MSEDRKIKQFILETRNIMARIIDEGGEFERIYPVFAWVIYDDDDMEPLFIHKDYQINSYPYGVSTIKRVSRKDVDVVEYIWE